jgi:hypothetical protein
MSFRGSGGGTKFRVLNIQKKRMRTVKGKEFKKKFWSRGNNKD